MKGALTGLVIAGTALTSSSAETDNAKFPNGRKILNFDNIEERVTYNEESKNMVSETRFANHFYSGIFTLKEKRKTFGGNLKLGNSSMNVGYDSNNDLETTRINLETKVDDWLFGAGHQSKEMDSRQDLIKAYVTKDVGDKKIELSVDNEPAVVSTYKTPIDDKNSVLVGGAISGTDYWRAGTAWGHTGKIGFLAYAQTGKNANGSKHTDIRIRGGLGNKQGKDSVGILSLRGTGFTEHSLMYDPTCIFYTGPFNNFNASIRGDPVGFDVRYKNGTAYAEVAGKLGRFTFMPKISYNKDTHDTGLNTELHVDLGKGFSTRLQNKITEDKKPSQAILVGYEHNF